MLECEVPFSLLTTCVCTLTGILGVLVACIAGSSSSPQQTDAAVHGYRNARPCAARSAQDLLLFHAFDARRGSMSGPAFATPLSISQRVLDGGDDGGKDNICVQMLRRTSHMSHCPGKTATVLTAVPDRVRATSAPLASGEAALEASNTSPVLEEIVWKDMWFDRVLQRFLEQRILLALDKDALKSPQPPGAATPSTTAVMNRARLSHKGLAYESEPLNGRVGGHDEYDDMLRATLLLSRKPARDTRAITLSLLNDLFPAWCVPAFGMFLSWWPMWFDARHAAASSVLLTSWLVGPSKIIDIDPALLDPDCRPGWGNTPSGALLANALQIPAEYCSTVHQVQHSLRLHFLCVSVCMYEGVVSRIHVCILVYIYADLYIHR